MKPAWYLEFMPAKKNIITLTDEERRQLESLARSTRRSPREKMRARILLLRDAGREGGSLPDGEIARQLRCAPLTVSQVPTRAAERGALAATRHKEQERPKARALGGEQEAYLVALSCSAPPEGQKRWSLKLLKERLIEREIIENIGCQTIRRRRKKTRSSRG